MNNSYDYQTLGGNVIAIGGATINNKNTVYSNCVKSYLH